jgi:methylenetetrahydrofolate dehydrogenase (NADP+)/methenyltetrahydrofolate cyclohydrolase
MAEIIDGKLVSSVLREKLKDDITAFKYTSGIIPGLAVIIVGDNPASQVYVRNKKKACEQVGINSYEFAFPSDASESDVLKCIKELNADPMVHGILVQLPLPDHINEETVIHAIDPYKDVDAFHPFNVGKIMIGDYLFLPCAPAGVMDLLDYYNIEVSGKKCVVLGRSNIVGKPMAHLLLQRNGTVTVCHSKTQNLDDEIRGADILVVAIGRPEFVKADMIKPGAVVIDVGINRGDDGKLVGDVAYSEVFDVASHITPVPGGVGPMTITTLLKNTLSSARQYHFKNN